MRRSLLHGCWAVSLAALALACGSGGPGHTQAGGPSIDGGEAGAAGASDTGSDAPALDPTVASSFGDAFSFLYDGPNATQTGVQPGAIDKRRIAIVRGLVEDPNGLPLAGAAISSPENPQYRSTQTRSDGSFDFVVNGGGVTRLEFIMSGFLPLSREVKPAWQTFEPLHPVFLSRLDPKVTEITLDGASSTQLVQGSTISDRSGSRTGALIFGAGTTANAVLKNGKKQALSTAHVHITEYTAGDNGPKAMPASLPAQSGYTYAVELTVDEASDLGAKTVEFSKPVPYYVENFLKFPAGEAVPAGYYDRDLGKWVAEPSGLVVNIIDVVGGVASLDVDGDGKVDKGTALSDLGIDDAELQSLGATYTKGASLWRIPLGHFSTWDFNWCFFGQLFDAVGNLFDGINPLDDDCIANGSVIECHNQILGESVPLSGTAAALHYRSDRVPGRREAYQFDLSLTKDAAPPKAKRVRFELEVLGRHLTYVADAAPDLSYHFDWDGLDAYGRKWQGPAPVRYRVGYVYDGWYGHTPVFGAYGEDEGWAPVPDTGAAPSFGVTADDDLARKETTLWLGWQSTTLGTFDARALGFGGFTLGNHHAYDPNSQTLYLGTGDRRHAGSSRDAVRALIGKTDPTSKTTDDPRTVELDGPHGVAIAPDGTIYLADENHNRVVRLTTAGKLETLAGTGTSGYSGDGGPATKAELSKPLGLALDKDGTLYIAERGNLVVRRVQPDGTIDTFAGGGSPKSGNGDGGPATGALLGEPHALAIGRDGSLFIADAVMPSVRCVRSNGLIETVLGDGTDATGGDGGPGAKAEIQEPLGLAVGPDDSLYVADYEANRIRKLAPDGTVSTVAGTGASGNSGDGGPATVALLNGPHTVDVGPDGALYIADEANFRVRKVTPDGIIHALAGGGTQQAAEFVPAEDAKFSQPRLVAVEPGGRLLIADYTDELVYRLSPFLPSSDPNGYTIPSSSGSEYFVFDAAGRHTKTVDAITGQARVAFTYDSNGRLSSFQDSNDRTTKITRNDSGLATQIASPDGLISSLSYSKDGWLSSVENPAHETHLFTLDASGLLTSETDGAGLKHAFEFDDLGRLTKDTSPSGYFQSLARSADKITVTRTTQRGLETSYARSTLDDGEEQSTLTQPDGRVERTTFTAGAEHTERGDGSFVDTEFASDPRFGLAAKYPSKVTTQTPGGRSTEIETTRDVTLSNADAPTSLQSVASTVSLNGTPVEKDEFDVATLTRTLTQFGVTSVVKQDAHGRVTEIDPAGGYTPITFSYDLQGRLSETDQGARSHTFSYDSSGFLEADTDALGVATTFTHDAVGRVLSAARAKASTTFDFATGGLLKSLTTPGGNQHAFGYDSGGRNTVYQAPALAGADTSDTAYNYGQDDYLEKTTLPSGRVETGKFDTLGRASGWQIPESSVDIAYNATNHQIERLIEASESIAYQWDGPLLLSTTFQGAVAGTVSRDYDANLRQSSESAGDVAISFAYDDFGRLVQAGDETVAYGSDGQSVSFTALGQVSEKLNRSADFGELSAHSVSGAAGAALYSASFKRDAAGRITSKEETVLGVSTSQAFEYDDLGRLSAVTRGTTKTTYAYDADSNRLDAGASFDAQDELLLTSAASYTFDADGRLATRTIGSVKSTFSYDTVGRLRRVDLPTVRLDYVVDPLGRRVGKRVNSTLTQGFLYDVHGRVVAELDGAGKLVSRFAYASRAHVPDFMEHGGNTYRLVTDYLGSVRLVVDTTSGAVAQALDYDAWGNVLNDTAPAFQPFGFAGGLYDSDTGLTHFGARDYDAKTGRWTAKDPLLFGGGQTNVYVYVGDDPVNHIDPSGLCVSATAGNAALVAIGVVAAVLVPELLVAAEAAEAVEGLAIGAEAVEGVEAAEGGEAALSTLRQSSAGEQFFHYGYAEQAANFEQGILPGGYGTTAEGLSGAEAQSGLALPHPTPPNAVYTVSPPPGTWVQVNPTAAGAFGQPGGLPEVQFIYGTGPGTVSGPVSLP
jgi:RHS repeat-associated protein